MKQVLVVKILVIILY